MFLCSIHLPRAHTHFWLYQPADSRINFGNLNTAQFSANLPTYPPYQPQSYIQSIRQHHPHHPHYDLGGHDLSPMHSISPLLPPCLPQISVTDSSGGGGRSTGTSSPASSCGCIEQGSTLIHHHTLRGNSTSPVAPISTTITGVSMTPERTKAAARRSRTSTSNTAADDAFASDEDDLPHACREKSVSKCHKQRIENKQRRCDELRDVCCRLKDVLPVSNQKSTRVSVLNRGKFALCFMFLPTFGHATLFDL
jgi:hypothetical protein